MASAVVSVSNACMLYQSGGPFGVFMRIEKGGDRTLVELAFS